MRGFLRIGAMTVAVGLVAVLAGRAQPIDAEITYYHRQKMKEDTVRGTIIEESPGIIAYRLSGRTEKLPASDVLEVIYQPSRALVRQEYRRAQRFEDEIEKATDAEGVKKAVQQALESYAKLLPQMTDSRFAQRHIAYKLVQLAGRLAEVDLEQREPAVAALSKFLQEHGNGWQVAAAAKLLAQLQLDKDDLAGALKTFETLAARPDLSRETRLEYQLLAVRALMRIGKYDEALKQLRALQGLLLPEERSMALRLNIYLAGCQGMLGQLPEAEKQLGAVLAGDADPSLKALACNTLGDYYRKAGKEEEAFWRYLMVDTLYNQDPEEHARALYHLALLFDRVKNSPARAQECRERLLKEKQYASLEYRRLVLKEK
jgi:hypothetical protein